jgi:hypothetical protein
MDLKKLLVLAGVALLGLAAFNVNVFDAVQEGWAGLALWGAAEVI